MNPLILGLVLVVGAPGQKEKSKPAPKIEGEWIVESLEGPGKEKKGDVHFTFTADQVMIKEAARDRSEDAGYTVDLAKTPGEIDIKPGNGAGPTIHGIIKIDGDTMQICFAMGADRPKEFKFEPGKPFVLVTLKRDKTEKK